MGKICDLTGLCQIVNNKKVKIGNVVYDLHLTDVDLDMDVRSGELHLIFGIRRSNKRKPKNIVERLILTKEVTVESLSIKVPESKG